MSGAGGSPIGMQCPCQLAALRYPPLPPELDAPPPELDVLLPLVELPAPDELPELLAPDELPELLVPDELPDEESFWSSLQVCFL